MTCFYLGHHIQRQPTLLKGETTKGAAERSGKAGFLLALLLMLRFSGAWKIRLQPNLF